MLKRTALAAMALSLLTLAACGDDSDDAGSPDEKSSSTVATEGADTTPETDPATGSEGEPDAAAGSCDYATDTQPASREVDAPPAEPKYSGDVKATISTTAGELPITLDGGHAPCTVNSFVSLTEQGFYDDTPCPRLATNPGFVLLQCGDPTGTGTGGPGYTVPDEYTADETYPAGTLAMANTGAPNSGGSQFFICIEDTQLNPAYTAFGTVDEEGLKALRKVAEGGDDGSHPAGGGKPNIAVDITKVTVS
ncbi:peptidylprolyl isomerase [Nocardioides alcanivorans]|uniref:peptidylprolyl isomerase n=1 Tax=Nocardioides alcanivorans TaxID=2897352 RepID=UPI001F1E9824|nr:peptidylprolyl isomerase [Nocardioides alcanivorans]